MSRLILSIIGALLLILDVSLGGLLTLGSIRPSLSLPFVVYVGLQYGPIEGTLAGFALGLGLDVLGALPIGATSFIYTIIGFACGKLWHDGPFRLLWPWGIFLAVSCCASEAVSHYLISRGTGLTFFPLFFQNGLPAAFYTTLLGLLWFLSPLHRVRSL
jgi:rod shape-determining protein MreD